MIKINLCKIKTYVNRPPPLLPEGFTQIVLFILSLSLSEACFSKTSSISKK
jgi:hypothetical protein